MEDKRKLLRGEILSYTVSGYDSKTADEESATYVYVAGDVIRISEKHIHVFFGDRGHGISSDRKESGYENPDYKVEGNTLYKKGVAYATLSEIKSDNAINAMIARGVPTEVHYVCYGGGGWRRVLPFTYQERVEALYDYIGDIHLCEILASARISWKYELCRRFPQFILEFNTNAYKSVHDISRELSLSIPRSESMKAMLSLLLNEALAPLRA